MLRTVSRLIVVLVAASCSNVSPNSTGDAPATPGSTLPPAATAVTSAASTTTTAIVPPAPVTTTVPATTTTINRSHAGERMQDDLAVLVRFGVREAGSGPEADAAGFLRSSLEGLGSEVAVGAVPLPNGLSSSNLVVSFGDGPVQVLFGAHYDSKPPSPGADDNGSGTVVLLELARRLGESPVPGVKVTVAFFGAEEILIGFDNNAHHFGSRLLADQMEADGNLPDFMVSADMVGVGERLLAATYLDSDPSAAELLVEAAAGLEIGVQTDRRGDISDHEAFARKSVPSVFLWRPDNADYHLATDDQVRTKALLEDLAILEAFLDLVALRG